MKRPSSPRGRLLCAGLMIVAVLTLLGHVWAESLANAGPTAAAHDDHQRGPLEAPDSAHAVLCAATLSGAQSGCPTSYRGAAALLATTAPLVAPAATRIPGMGAVPPARGTDGSPPLFLLHATFLI